MNNPSRRQLMQALGCTGFVLAAGCSDEVDSGDGGGTDMPETPEPNRGDQSTQTRETSTSEAEKTVTTTRGITVSASKFNKDGKMKISVENTTDKRLISALIYPVTFPFFVYDMAPNEQRTYILTALYDYTLDQDSYSLPELLVPKQPIWFHNEHRGESLGDKPARFTPSSSPQDRYIIENIPNIDNIKNIKISKKSSIITKASRKGPGSPEPYATDNWSLPSGTELPKIKDSDLIVHFQSGGRNNNLATRLGGELWEMKWNAKLTSVTEEKSFTFGVERPQLTIKELGITTDSTAQKTKVKTIDLTVSKEGAMTPITYLSGILIQHDNTFGVGSRKPGLEKEWGVEETPQKSDSKYRHLAGVNSFINEPLYTNGENITIQFPIDSSLNLPIDKDTELTLILQSGFTILDTLDFKLLDFLDT